MEALPLLRDQRERGVVAVRGGGVCPWQGWSAMAKPTGPTRKNLEGAWPRVGRTGVGVLTLRQERGSDSGARLTEFGSSSEHTTSLGLSVHICKMDITTLHTSCSSCQNEAS